MQVERTNSGLSKTFLVEYLFVFAEYLCNRSSKIRTKNFKNLISILAIVNYQNWLDASLPLSLVETNVLSGLNIYKLIDFKSAK